jgi:hypothetical protein
MADNRSGAWAWPPGPIYPIDIWACGNFPPGRANELSDDWLIHHGPRIALDRAGRGGELVGLAQEERGRDWGNVTLCPAAFAVRCAGPAEACALVDRVRAAARWTTSPAMPGKE